MTNKDFDKLAIATWVVFFIVFLSSMYWLGNHPLTVITGLIFGLISTFLLLIYEDIH